MSYASLGATGGAEWFQSWRMINGSWKWLGWFYATRSSAESYARGPQKELYVLDGAGKRVIQPRTKPDHCYGPNRYYTDPSDEIRKPRPECV